MLYKISKRILPEMQALRKMGLHVERKDQLAGNTSWQEQTVLTAQAGLVLLFEHTGASVVAVVSSTLASPDLQQVQRNFQ
jgi:hypothetical protein